MRDLVINYLVKSHNKHLLRWESNTNEEELQDFRDTFFRQLNENSDEELFFEFINCVLDDYDAIEIDKKEDLHLGCPSYPNCNEAPQGCSVLQGKDVEWYGHRD